MEAAKQNNQQQTSDLEEFEKITKKLTDTYKAKNHDYGNSFHEVYVECGFTYAYGHLKEKVNRINTLRKGDPKVIGESLEDSLLDLANYAILSLIEVKSKNQNNMPNGLNITCINGSRVINVEKGHQLSIIDGKYFVDGVEVDLNGDLSELKKQKQLHLTINGNVGKIDVSHLASIKVNGDVKGSVSTVSGGVSAKNIGGSVSTVSGNVGALHIDGDVSTVSGDIMEG